MQDRINQVDENLLHRTAGPYSWVKSGTTQSEYISSALPSIADIIGTGKRGSRLAINATIPMSVIEGKADNICSI